VRVEEKIGSGKVKISLTFPEWKEGRVAPGKFEIEVSDDD